MQRATDKGFLDGTDFAFVLETIRTCAMRIMHITVKTERRDAETAHQVCTVLSCLNFQLKNRSDQLLSETKLSSVQCPFARPPVQLSSLRRSSAHVHRKRLSQRIHIHHVTTKSRQQHPIHFSFWPHREAEECDVCCAIFRGDQELPSALQVQNHHCPSTSLRAYPQLSSTHGRCAYTNSLVSSRPKCTFQIHRTNWSTTPRTGTACSSPLTSQAPFIRLITTLLSHKTSQTTMCVR